MIKMHLKKTFPPLQMIHHYPAFRGFLWMSLGIILANIYSGYEFPIITVPLVLLISMLVHRKTTILFSVVGFIAFSSETTSYTSTVEKITKSPRLEYELTFHSSPRYTTDKGIVQSAIVKNQQFTAVVDCFFTKPLLPGELRIIGGRFEKYDKAEMPWKLSDYKIGRLRGVHGTITIDTTLSKIASSTTSYTISQFIETQLSRYDNPTRSLLKALFRADRSEISTGVKELFNRSGISHLLAMSGQHIATIIVIITLLLRPFPLPKQLTLGVTIALPWIVLLFTGPAASILRALVMSSILLASFFAQRPTSLLNTLGGAAVVLLLQSPGQLFSPGFQLSFAAVAGIIGALHLVNTFIQNHTIRKLALFVLIPIAAGTLTAPITAAIFGTTVPIGIIANVFLTPLFSLYFIIVIPLCLAGVRFEFARDIITILSDAFLDTTQLLIIKCNQPLLEMTTLTPSMILIPLLIVLIFCTVRGKRIIVVTYLTLIYLGVIQFQPHIYEGVQRGTNFYFREKGTVDILCINDEKSINKDLIRWLKKRSHKRVLIINICEGNTGKFIYTIRKHTQYEMIYSLTSNKSRSSELPQGVTEYFPNDVINYNSEKIIP